MSTTLRISVTKEILEKSKFCSDKGGVLVGTNCAISLAIRDAFPDAFVSGTTISFLKDDWNERVDGFIAMTNKVELPKEAEYFVFNFDNSTPEERVLMDELEFEIEVPQRVIDAINIDELKPLLQNHPTLELIEK